MEERIGDEEEKQGRKVEKRGREKEVQLVERSWNENSLIFARL